MDSLLHNSLAQPPLSDFEKEAKSKYTGKLRMIETLNLLLLIVWAATWVLNFIFVGWFGAFAVILIYSWFYTLFSALFVIGRHQQRYNVFNKVKRIMLIAYATQIVAWILCLAFFIVGCVYMNKYPNMDPFEQKTEYMRYRNGKWMIVVSIFFALYTPSFTAFVKEYKAVQIDEEKVFDDDESSTNSDDKA